MVKEKVVIEYWILELNFFLVRGNMGFDVDVF